MLLGQDKERAIDGEPQDLAGGPTVFFCVEGRMVDPAQGGLLLDSRQVLAKGFCGANSSRIQLVLRKGCHWGKGDTESNSPKKGGVFVRKWLMPSLFYPSSCH